MGDLREKLINQIAMMNEGQLGFISVIVNTFSQPIKQWRNTESDIVDELFLEAFGDFLKLHHSLSVAYLDKTRFEAALERILKSINRKAERPKSQTHRGHDITVDGKRWSLKTQGDKTIKEGSLFISKFMELGGGQWGDTDIQDIAGLRDQFLNHLKGYDRIFQLRYFHSSPTETSPEKHRYELVEIPKALLEEAEHGTLDWSPKSRTRPRCAYCTVIDNQKSLKFRLYFDGGGERKLQIKNLQKALCVVHASWEF